MSDNPIAHAFAVNPAGRAVAQTDEQALASQNAGYSAIGGDMARAQAKAAQDANYVDQNWGTAGKAAAGVASGLTLGLAPSFASRLGLVDKGHLEAAEQSGAYTAGDVAGMLAPALLTGGESAAAEGVGKGIIARALGASPAGLLGSAGSGAEQLIGHFLPEAGLFGKLGTPAIRMAARGATEGAIVNLSHTIADNVIQNKPLAAQSLLASGVDGALFGGLTGGILGGAGAVASAGLDAVGGRVAAGTVGRGAEDQAGHALKRMGATESDLAKFKAADGDLVTTVKRLYNVIGEDGKNLASDTGTIRSTASKMADQYGAVAKDAIERLQSESASVLDGRLAEMSTRIKTDLIGAYQGTVEQGNVARIFGQLNKELKGMKTWEHWAKTREQLANRMQEASGVQQDVYKRALNAFDGELESAMTKANPELATTYQSAVTGQRNAQELFALTGKRTAQEAGRASPLHLNGADAATFGYSVLAGANPLVGAGIIAGKKIVGHLQAKLEPAMAESAYRSAIGAHAASAQVEIGNRLTSSLDKFLTGTRLTADNEHAKPELSKQKLSYTMKSFNDAMDAADELTSQSHQAKVREMMQALTTAGHPDLAKEMGDTYGRAVAYVNQNKPKGRSNAAVRAGSIGKLPQSMGLNTQDMKFIRQLHAMRDPQDAIFGGLERGDLSRDAVRVAKYVIPDVMNMVVAKVYDRLVAYKEEGKFVPADKIAMLGVLLDAPLDSKLQSGFIDAVQQGLAANKSPPPSPDAPPPPNPTDVTPYQTPLQSSV